MRKFVLTIAGLDPSSGAGLTADIKTFEQHKVYGLSVCTAITVQTEDVFSAIRWEKSKDVLDTLNALLGKYDVAVIKTGIMPSLDYFSEIINWLWVNHPTIKIVVDPVFKSSTGFDFVTKINEEQLYSVLQKCYLITPNIAEVKLMSGINDSFDTARLMAKYCNIYLKGGHSKKNLGVDYLFLNDRSDKKMFTYNPKNISISSKHGSGCVLSVAIVANLAIGFTIEESCGLAKVYVEKILTSNNTLLAYHKNE